MRTGYLACPFDLIDIGDLDLIDQAVRRCSRLVVGVYSDELVESVSGRRPVIPLEERLELVSHLRGVSEVVVHDPNEPAPGDHVLVFTVAERGTRPASEDGNVLTPARQSTSEFIRRARRPVTAVESVA